MRWRKPGRTGVPVLARLCLFQTHGAKWPGGLQTVTAMTWWSSGTRKTPAVTYFLMLAFRLPGPSVRGPNPSAKKWTRISRLLEKAILEIGRQAEGLDEITRSSETIRSSNEKIANRARIMRDGLSKANQHLERKGGWPERVDRQPWLIPGCADPFGVPPAQPCLEKLSEAACGQIPLVLPGVAAATQRTSAVCLWKEDREKRDMVDIACPSSSFRWSVPPIRSHGAVVGLTLGGQEANVDLIHVRRRARNEPGG